MKMKRLFILITFILGLFNFAYAQYGKIIGKVVDAKSGQPIVAAAVYIEELGIGTYTDDKGEFVLLRVPPGTYTLKVEFTGYSPFVLKNLVVEADRTISPLGGIIKLQETGIVLQEQVVIAREPIIKKDLTASVDKIRSEKLQNLPVANVEQALQLQAGVRRYGGHLQIRGGRTGEVAYVVDGADLRDPYTNASTPNLPLNAISEVSVNKGGFGAEYGNAASGVVEVVTKEGTDKYEFQLRARTSDFGFLSNLYIGSKNIGLPIYNFLSTGEGDVYAKWFDRKYMGSYYDQIFGYEILRQKKYSEMNFKSEDPLFSDIKPLYTDGMPFPTTFYNQKQDLKRIEFTASGPIIKKYLRFSGTIDIQNSNGRFSRLNAGERSIMPNRNNQFNYQAKITALPNQKIKVFGSVVGTRAFTSYWEPEWRIAPTHSPYTKTDILGLIGGINFLISPKTYSEIRFSRYRNQTIWNSFEDINMDGIDDFADRDKDGYVEIDTNALKTSVLVGNQTYSYFCSDLLNMIRNKPGFADPTRIPGVVELRAFWWQTPIINCYPQQKRIALRLLVGITPSGDTVAVSDELNVPIKDTLYRISGINIPNPLNYDRTAFGWRYNYTNQLKFDFVQQDFANLKGHEFKAGFEYRTIRLRQDIWDFASGGNVYPSVVDADPKQFAFYVRDKIEFEGLIANVGLRFDYFDPNAYVPADYEIPVKVNNNSDFANPDTLGGAWTWDNGYGIRRDTLNINNPVKVKPYYYISPRIGISHPISENDVLHFTYGHYFQVPLLARLYSNQWWIFSGAYPRQGNPALKPEKTISYELGIRHAFNPYIYIDITGFYKDIYDLVQSKRYDMHEIDPITGQKVRIGKWYTVFVNEDYATVRGIEIQLSKQIGGGLGILNNLFFDINYTFQVARGSSSSPISNYFNEYYGLAPGFTQEFYLDWDQRHGIVINVGYMIPFIAQSPFRTGWGGSFVWNYGTALPYSPEIRTPRDYLELTNTLRFYSQSVANLNLYKSFIIKGLDLRIFSNVYNLFNNRVLVTYSNQTYWFGYGPNSDACRNGLPTCLGQRAAEGPRGDISVYSLPRITEIGFEINWRR
jgi:outer membrane receptor protein involved in Fe transport